MWYNLAAMNKDQVRSELLNILKKDAFFKKKITLSSGKTSDYYLDVRRVSLSSKGIFLISEMIWDLIKGDSPTAIGGPTLGADPIVAGVCMRAHQEGGDLKGFIIRKTPKKHGRQNLIEGRELSSSDKVVIVDDVATSGSSLIYAADVLKKENVSIVRAVSVIDRQEGAAENLAASNIAFNSLFARRDFINET